MQAEWFAEERMGCRGGQCFVYCGQPNPPPRRTPPIQCALPVACTELQTFGSATNRLTAVSGSAASSQFAH